MWGKTRENRKWSSSQCLEAEIKFDIWNPSSLQEFHAVNWVGIGNVLYKLESLLVLDHVSKLKTADNFYLIVK